MLKRAMPRAKKYRQHPEQGVAANPSGSCRAVIYAGSATC
jgi:hypothetical protein